MAAPAPYDNASRTAVLLAYQPRNGLVPGEWSGAELTASSRYTNPDVPMAAATAGDDSLADFMDNYHAVWDGFLQLRMYFGAADEPQYSLHYPTLDIQVQGDTWQSVGGGPVDCTAGTAESIESIVLPSTTTGTTSSAGAGSSASGAAGNSSGSGSSSGTSTGASGTTGAPGADSGAVAPTPVTATQSGSSHGWLATALVVVLVAAAAWFVVRGRRPGVRGEGSEPDAGDPTDGATGASGSGSAATDPADADPVVADHPSHRPDQTVTSSSNPSSSSSGTSMKGQHP
jgi:hypothetical protein